MEAFISRIRALEQAGQDDRAVHLAMLLPDVLTAAAERGERREVRNANWFRQYMATYQGFLHPLDFVALQIGLRTGSMTDLSRVKVATGDVDLVYFTKRSAHRVKVMSFLVLNASDFIDDILRGCKEYRARLRDVATVDQLLDVYLATVEAASTALSQDLSVRLEEALPGVNSDDTGVFDYLDVTFPIVPGILAIDVKEVVTRWSHRRAKGTRRSDNTHQ